jgi:hypothetical protein
MTIPPELLWPGVVVIVVIAIFLTAALAGPLIHANTRDEIDDPETRDACTPPNPRPPQSP